MSWTSTNALTNTGAVRAHSTPIYALIATGLGLGMLFSHAIQFSNHCSGATPYLHSWILLFTSLGTGLGYLGANKFIASTGLHRWGLVGWAGLVTGIISWLMPVISQKLAPFWLSPGRPDGFLLIPSLITSMVLGLMPGCIAGLSIGATTNISSNLQHPHQNKNTGWLLLAGGFGFLLTELLLIQKFGLEFSNPMGALVWLLVGAGGLITKASCQIQKQFPKDENLTAQTGETPHTVQSKRMGIYLGLAAACFLTVWMRVSDWVFGNTFFWGLYWPNLALAALGVGLLAPVAKAKTTTRNMSWGLALLGVFHFCLLYTMDDMPFWLHHLRSQLGETTVSFPIHALVYTAVVGGIMLAPLYGIGCLAHYSTQFQSSTTRISPSIQMVLSTAITWTVLQHFVMPMIGLARVGGLGIATIISLAIYFTLQSHEKWKGLSKIAAPVGGILLISFTGSHFDKKWRHIFSQSNDVATGFFSTREEADSWAYRSDQISYKESIYGSVAIHSYDYPGNSQLELRINGEVIERGYVHQIKPIINTMVPYVLHGNPEHVAVFGLRSGSAAGILASLPSIKQLDGIEYQSELLNVIGKFANSNGNLAQRDSFHFHNTTPLRFLHQTDEELDIIINQYARPWNSLNSSWFSLEFYKKCAKRLRKEGLMVQNIQTSHLDDPTLETVIATFGSVFNQTSIWKLGHGEWMLIGTHDRREWPFHLLKERIQAKEVQSILNTQDLSGWPMLLTTQVTGFDKGFHLVPDESLMHSQNYPALRMLGSNAYASPSPLTLLEKGNEHFDPRSSLILGDFAKSTPWTIEQLRAFSILQLDHQLYDPKVFRSVIKRWLNLSPDETTLQILSASTSKAESPWTYESARLNALLASFPADTEPPLELVKQAAFHGLQAYRDQRTFVHRPDTSFLEAMLDHMIRKDPVNQRVYRMDLAELAWDEGNTDAFLKFSEEALDPEIEEFGPVDYSAEPMAPYRTLALMAEHWWRNGQLEKAKQVCIQALQANYIGPEADFNHPGLEQVVRKILFTLDLPAQAANGTKSNLELQTVE